MSRKRRDIPWLEWRKGIAYVAWYDETKRRTGRLSLHTEDRLEAKKRYAAFLIEGHALVAGGAPAASGGFAGLTAKQALDDYTREHVNTKVIDKTRAENAIRHLKDFFGNRRLAEIDIPASRAYAAARRMGAVGGGRRHPNREGSDSTIRRELVVLQAAANHALRWRRITPAELPSIELPAEARHEAPWLTRDELARVFNAASGPLADFAALAYYTAGRRKSVERLTKFQVDLKNNRINLRGPNEDANQRNSRKRRPIVPIDPKVRPVVERLLSEGDTEWLLGTPVDMYRRFNRLLSSLGLADKGNPHILRHSRATHLLQDGVSLYDVAKLLGDTVATVERVYGHHCPDYLGETIKGRAS